MGVALSPGIIGVHLSFNNTCTMPSKRAWLKENIESVTRDAVEQVSIGLPMYEDSKLFIDKENKMKWKYTSNIFLGTFEENLGDEGVYVNIHKSGLYQITCKDLAFPCVNMIH